MAEDYGYADPPTTGYPISGLENLDPDVLVFHGATEKNAKGGFVTAGGRILTVVGRGPTLEAARAKAYDNIKRIVAPHTDYRRNIALL